MKEFPLSFSSNRKRKRDRESISWWKEGITIADWQRRPTTFPKRFRLAKHTTFGQRHLNKWSQSSFSLWMTLILIFCKTWSSYLIIQWFQVVPDAGHSANEPA
ncbi:MLO-like protein 12 [Glycine soja]